MRLGSGEGVGVRVAVGMGVWLGRGGEEGLAVKAAGAAGSVGKAGVAAAQPLNAPASNVNPAPDRISQRKVFIINF